MPDTAKIIKAITDMRESINDSFGKVYVEINGCSNRVTEIETALEVKKALCKKKKEDDKKEQDSKKENRDFWKPIIRIITIAGFFALLSIAWEKIKAVLDLVP